MMFADMLNLLLEPSQISHDEAFVCQVDDMQKVMNNCTRERAIEHIAFGEGISEEEFKHYGLEILEYNLNLKFGSIAKWLSE